MQHYQQFINGEFTDAISGKKRHIINPATEEIIATVPDSQPEDADAAIIAARHAFDSGVWSKLYAGDRAKALLRLSALCGSILMSLLT